MFGNRSILLEAPRPAAIRRYPRAPWLAVGVVCFGAFMGQLDASIVTLTLVSALPADFGIAALSGEALFPAAVSNRVRGAIGAGACAVALTVLIIVPATDPAIAGCLALAGLGLGIFVPANNAVIMRSSVAGSAAVLGGLVNIARGIGTTLGIALVTLALHVTAGSRPGAAGRAGSPDVALALGVLAAAAAAGAVTALLIRPLPAGDAGPRGPDGGGPDGGGPGGSEAAGSGPGGAGHGEVGHATAFS
jgi:hypothetical protein